ncbi:hypothetical protein [Flavobacterium nackdongense]|uniref:Uncharacterized protein n=1 Tax=Flavobacterium nackdongense TaxID=2547394 RepID=A0A4P6YEX5_9FLAO|nr:hypothetical protein [Flavobacterium nackdongense]QBN19277.1 hypothetical protein E1750_10840 [Flavobacterium nackdongense]
MNFWKDLFNKKNIKKKLEERVRITPENISNWSKINAVFQSGQTKFDSQNRLRYLHRAPVGDLILIRVAKNGEPIYKESAEEWFDPESQKAINFIWT